MPVGPIVDCVATLLGCILGAALANKIPDRLKAFLTLTFGAASLAMGIITIVKMNSLPPVILSLILGSIIGELFSIENRINKLALKLKEPIQKLFPGSGNMESEEAFLGLFISGLVLFNASGTGIFGALKEGVDHSSSILISKAFLDFFTAMIFATSWDTSWLFL